MTEEEKERSKKYKKILTPFFCGFEKYTSKKGICGLQSYADSGTGQKRAEERVSVLMNWIPDSFWNFSGDVMSDRKSVV